MNDAENLKKEIQELKNSSKKEGSGFFGRFFNSGPKPAPPPAPTPNSDYHDYTAEATKKRMTDKLNQNIDNKRYGNKNMPTTTSTTTSRPPPPAPSSSNTKQPPPNMKNDKNVANDKSKGGVKLSEYEEQIMSEMLDATPGVYIYVYIYILKCVYIHIYIYICMYGCIYIYMYMNIHIHRCTFFVHDLICIHI
jgi:hypothetical protein